MRYLLSFFVLLFSLSTTAQRDTARAFQQVRISLNVPFAVSGEARPGFGVEFMHYGVQWERSALYLLGGIHVVNTSNLDSNVVYDFENAGRTIMYNHKVQFWEVQLGLGYRSLIYGDRFGYEINAHVGLGASRLHGALIQPNPRDYTYWNNAGFTGGGSVGLFYVCHWNEHLIPLSIGYDWNHTLGKTRRRTAYSHTGPLPSIRFSIGWLFC
ncbi:hypothetical protein [Phaeocystidibacter marisrubri]|uniref:DUF3575 domain-containing protein n=1 Tax=Phaeocystidibacter marisrubri TaxID=1577780 RepID=A0A6L3ZH76_9FLAO|nr:hypothetical protein [Phaeocystidibacter marisrubri]KAB2817376.1 hypothetical protein F8C82_02990 [Phaeocystidibacter marisrubri]